MKQKMVALFLVSMMVCGLFSGCGKTEEGGKVNVDNDTQKEENSDDAAEGEEKELQVVKVLAQYWPGDWSVKAEYEDGQYPALWKFEEDLAERGIKVEFEWIASDAYSNVVATRMATGEDIPDLVSYLWTGKGEVDVIKWANAGMVYSITELIEKYDTDNSIKTFYDEYAPGAWNQTQLPTGENYWFTYLASDPGSIDAQTGVQNVNFGLDTIQVRRDWIENLGMEVQDVYTRSEFKELLKTLQDADANGDGKNNEVFDIDITAFYNGIAQSFGLHRNVLRGYDKEKNIVYNNFYHENFPAYVEYMRELYKEGLIDPATIGAQDTLYLQNRSSANYNDCAWEYEKSMESFPGAKYFPIILDTDEDGDITKGDVTVTSGNEPTVTYGQYFVPKAASNPEGVMILMDYIYSLDFAILARLGVEGTGYEVDENGNYVKLASPSNDPSEQSYKDAKACPVAMLGVPQINVLPVVTERYGADADENYKAKKDWAFNFQQNLSQYMNGLGHEFWAMPSDEEAELISETENVLQTYCTELLTDLILERKSLDDLPKYLEELDELGMQEYLAVMQARRDRLVAE